MTDAPNYRDWIGNQVETVDALNLTSARSMQATLDQEITFGKSDILPPLWHWLYFTEVERASDLGRDGHPNRGGFLPPVTLPRRMWAGGQLTFHRPLRIAQEARRYSTIKSVSEKTGRSGQLCFVTVEHQIYQQDVLALTEEHDIVYREDPHPSAPQPAARPAPDNAAFSKTVQPSAVLLFRYSALTFNGHRIHYDVDYARDVEGYEGLVFHGPLNATLLAGLAKDQVDRPMQSFEFRGRAPITGMSAFQIEGRIVGDSVILWAKRADGALAMTAKAEF